MKDTRYVYGANCTWHGSIDEVKTAPGRDIVVNGRAVKGSDILLPCCPHCGGMLLEYPSRAIWDENVERFIVERLNGDRAYAAWLQSLHDSGACQTLKDWDWRADFEAWKAINVVVTQ